MSANIPTIDAIAMARAPFSDATSITTLTVTAVNASITLAEGVYEMFLSGTIVGVGKAGATTASLPPASGASLATGFLILPSAITSYNHPGGALHARLSATGTETLYISSKVL